jgi:transposase
VRGDAARQANILLALTPDQVVPADHPLRQIKPVVERALVRLSARFDEMYAAGGRPSIPPEHLLKGLVLMALFSVRSERQFCEQLGYNLLFKWFLDLNIDDVPFDHSTFSRNRERLLAHDVTGAFFAEVRGEAERRQLLSRDHFSVDGTLLQAWASQKSYRPRDEDEPPAGGAGRNPEVDFRGQRRRRETHASRTDPQALLYRKGKGQPAELAFLGHVLMENRHGLLVDVEFTQATGTAERDAAVRMLARRRGHRRVTAGADKGYDTRGFVAELRAQRVTPHVAQHTAGRRSAIDRRTTRHAGYATSQSQRPRVEQFFGWVKTVGATRKLRFVGVAANRMWFEITAAAYNLMRLAKLTLPVPA